MAKRAGIYKITNLANGKVYIGSSTNLDKRLSKHKTDLSKGKHPNTYLQQEWNYFRARVFEFEIAEELGAKGINAREQDWINFYQSWLPERGYNQTQYSTGPIYLRVRKRK